MNSSGLLFIQGASSLASSRLVSSISWFAGPAICFSFNLGSTGLPFWGRVFRLITHATPELHENHTRGLLQASKAWQDSPDSMWALTPDRSCAQAAVFLQVMPKTAQIVVEGVNLRVRTHLLDCLHSVLLSWRLPVCPWTSSYLELLALQK